MLYFFLQTRRVIALRMQCLLFFSKKSRMKGDIAENICIELMNTLDNFYNKKENKARIDGVLNNVIDNAMDKIKPYLVLITGLLIVAVLMNCLHFYYYVKMYIGRPI